MATWEGVWPWAKQADSEGVSLASKAIQPQAEEYHRVGLKGGEDLTYNRGRFQLSPAQLGQLLPRLPAPFSTTRARPSANIDHPYVSGLSLSLTGNRGTDSTCGHLQLHLLAKLLFKRTRAQLATATTAPSPGPTRFPLL